MAKLPSRPPGVLLDLTDLIHFVDVSDTTDDPLGTSKKATLQQLVDLTSTFTDTIDELTDTPINKTGSGGYLTLVNVGETALEYVNPATYNVSNFNNDAGYLTGITASNGLNESGADVKLGGDLTLATTIDGTTNDKSITIKTSDASAPNIEAELRLIDRATLKQTNTVTGELAEFATDVDNTTATFRYVETGTFGSFTMAGAKPVINQTTGGQSVTLDVGTTANQLKITDSRTTATGIEYAADYSANYTTRSLIDKAYADSKLGGNALDALVITPTVTEDGKVLAWNNTNNEYELIAAAASNIYTTDGTLAGNRSLTTGGNTFDIKLGVNPKFHIAADGRMGIGSSVLASGAQLTISGNTKVASLWSTTGSVAFGSALIAGVTAVFNGGATASIQFNGNMIAAGGPTTAAHFKRIRVLGVGAVAAVKPNTAIEIVSGNTDCLLMPIMTTAIRDLVGTPTAGHFIYNSNLKSMDYYDGTGWLSLDGAAAGDGNGIYDGGGSLTGGTTTVDLNSQRLLFSGTGQRMEIGVTGVGIGSGATTPNKTLVVHNGANTAFDFYSGAVPSIVFRSFSAYNGVQALTKFIAGPISGAGGDSGTLVVTTASGAVNTRWKSAANATLAVLEDSGDFGIGTALPTEKLHVVGNINATTGYKFNGTTGFTGTGAYTNFTIQGGIITAAS